MYGLKDTFVYTCIKNRRYYAIKHWIGEFPNTLLFPQYFICGNGKIRIGKLEFIGSEDIL